LVDSSHWTVGVGDPDAAAPNDATWPAGTVSAVGCVVTEGAAAVTVSVAALVVAVPIAFVNTASNR
jgi:hypothetical protein